MATSTAFAGLGASDPSDPTSLVRPLPQGDDLGSYKFWRAEIEASKDGIRRELAKWQVNVERYRGQPYTLANLPQSEFVQVNVDYYKTEAKKAQLFFRTPTVVLSPKRPDCAAAVPVFEAVLNEYLGPHGVNAKAAIDEVLSDVLMTGIGFVEVGFEGRIMPGQPAPPMAPGAIFGLSTPPATPPSVQFPRYYVRRGTPAKLLVPEDFTGSDYNEADWLGFEYYIDDSALEWVGGKGPSRGPTNVLDDELLVRRPWTTSRRMGRKCTKIWYRASRIDSTEPNPDKYRLLVLVDGVEEPYKHEDSPWQTFGPDGDLIAGVRGNPIKVLTLRYTSDWRFPASDTQMSRYQTDELSKVRTLQMMQKARSIPMRWVDRNRMDPSDIAKIATGEMQALIPLDGNGDEMIGVVALAALPRETSTYGDVINNDIEQTWALGANQQGVTSDTTRTATELNLIQSNTDVRLDAERGKVLAWFTTIAEALGGLIQQYADVPTYVKVVGPQAQQELQPWDRTTIAGQYVYEVKPDSSVRVDVAAEKKEATDLYQLVIKDPGFNGMEIRRHLATVYRLDPARMVQQPPPPPPDKPNLSLSLTAQDLTNPMVLSILQQSGFQMDPQALQNTLAMQSPHPGVMQAAMQNPAVPQLPPHQPPPEAQHGGTANEAQPINKHALAAQEAGGHR